ncbi:MAG: hypothetical protein CXZ00_03170 [Acidobacteria bacterium]|nr:MAG: hypothetical protein CXZ00_03170 [Acidobacteriota bacterium]
MTQKLESEFQELAASGHELAELRNCFLSQLSALARKEYGRNDRAATALGVHTLTLSRWNVAGRKLALGERIQSIAGRIAASLRTEQLSAAQCLTEFEQGLARAAVAGAKGNYQAAPFA